MTEVITVARKDFSKELLESIFPFKFKNLRDYITIIGREAVDIKNEPN